MKAYECDRCETYYQGSPAGVLYDNSDPRHGVRYDLCAECLEKVFSEVFTSRRRILRRSLFAY